MGVYDTKTGKEFEFEDPKQLKSAIESGQYGFKKGSKIKVYRPEAPDDVFEMPAENAAKAIEQGYEFETGFQRGVREYVSENDNLVGSMKVGLGEFANALTFGVPEIVMRNTASPLEWAKINALRDEHITASLLGEVGGIGANVYSLARSGALAATEKISEKAVEVMAKRITAQVGKKNISDAAAKTAARGILQKTAQGIKKGAGTISRNTAQGAIEGTIDMAIPAGAEALFGNYEEAAETLLLGTAFGGILGGATRTVGDMVGAGKDALLKRSAEATELGEGNKLQELILQAGSTQSNIPIDTMRYALKNAKDIDNAMPMSRNYNDVSAAAKVEFETLDRAKQELKAIEDGLAGKTNAKTTQMQELANNPNKGVEDELFKSTERVQNWLEEQSGIAESRLAQEVSTPSISIKPLAENLDKAVKKLKVGGVSKADRATIASIEDLSRTIKNELPEYVDGEVARKVLRSLRKDINYNTNLADFDEELNKVLKGVTEGFSDSIKGHSPGYAAQMAEMAPKAQILNKLRPYVSSSTKRLGIGKALTSNTPNATDQAIRDVMDEFIAGAKTIDGLESVDQAFADAIKDQKAANIFKKNRRAMTDARGGTAKDEFYAAQFPEDFELLQQRRSAFSEAEESYKRLRPLVNTKGIVLENKLKKFLDEDNNIALGEAYEFLAQKHPDLGDIKKRLKDSLVKESFEKARTQGSRATNLTGAVFGGTAGAVVGPVGALLGGAIGAATGAYIDRFGGKMFQKLLKETPTASKIRSLLVAEDQLGKFARELDDIPNKIEKAVLGKDSASSYRKVNIVTNQLINQIINSERGDSRDKKDKKKATARDGALLNREARLRAFDILSKKFADLSDSNLLQEELSTVSGAVLEGGGPNLGMKVMEKMTQGVEYLSNEIPKDPLPVSPFIKKGQEWQPSDYDLRAFEEKLLVVSNPMIVFDAMDAGVLTKNHVDALQNVYAALYNQITQKVVESISTGELDLMYKDRVALGNILDMPVDPTTTAESYAYYQARSGTSEEEVAEEQARQSAESFKPNLNIDTRKMQTTTQRIGAIA